MRPVVHSHGGHPGAGPAPGLARWQTPAAPPPPAAPGSGSSTRLPTKMNPRARFSWVRRRAVWNSSSFSSMVSSKKLTPVSAANCSMISASCERKGLDRPRRISAATSPSSCLRLRALRIAHKVALRHDPLHLFPGGRVHVRPVVQYPGHRGHAHPGQLCYGVADGAEIFMQDTSASASALGETLSVTVSETVP